jgi:GAF domain-containing protein/HAMP domain-containing protein
MGKRVLPLATRFLLALVAAAIVPLLIVSVLGIVNSLVVQRAQISDLQQEATKNAANTIDNYLEKVEDEMILSSQRRTVVEDESLTALLDGLLAYNVGFETLAVMDVTGQEVAKRSRYLLFGPNDLQDRSDAEEFVTALSGERYLGPISISQYSEPLVTLAIPLENVRGQVEGVLSAEVNLKYMWDIIARLETGLGSYAYVVDGEGLLIAYRDSSVVLQGRNLRELQGVRDALQDQPIAGSYVGLDGEPVIGAYQGLQRADWYVVVEAPTRQALANVYRTLLINVGALIGTLVLAVFLGWYLARLVIRPLRDLQAGAAVIGAGDLSYRIEVQTRDEIGAMAVAFNTMADELQQMFDTLEQRVAHRTRDLEERATQLATAADVGRAAASILELESLAHQVVDLICERFDLYYAGLFLLDDAAEYAILEAGTGEPGRLMKEQEHRLRVGGVSMVGSACARHEARIALDVGAEAVRFDNPLLPQTRSEMALPLLVGDRVLGALDVQSTVAMAFTKEDITVLQIMADQVAVAIDNARKFSEESALVEATNPLFRASRHLSAATTSNEVAQAIIDSVSETEADHCLVAQYGISTEGEVTTVTFLAGWDRRGQIRSPIGVPLPASEPLFDPSLMMQSLAIEDVQRDPRVSERARQTLAQAGARALVNIPLRMGNQLLGFVNIGRATTGPWSPVVGRLYETLGDQAAVALERARLLEETQARARRDRLIDEISSRVQGSLDPDTILKTTVQELGRALGARWAKVEIKGRQGNGRGSAGALPDDDVGVVEHDQ